MKPSLTWSHTWTKATSSSTAATPISWIPYREAGLESYLIQLTAEVLAKQARPTGKPVVDVILNEAEQKGTGKWASQSALDLGIPVTAITEAVFARFLSALKADRQTASTVLAGPNGTMRAAAPGSLLE